MASAFKRAWTSSVKGFRSDTTTQAFKFLAWVPVGIFFTRHVYSVATITGGSMQPTFNPTMYSDPLHNDVVLLERWSATIGSFQRGDVVTLWSPQDPNLLTTKRIIALEGDIVHPLAPHSPQAVRIPAGHCWVEGDSRHHSRDSNTYGPIPLALINARVARILWPWSRGSKVENAPGKSEGRVKRHAKTPVIPDDSYNP